VSHDLRAPLRAIDGFTRIVLEAHAARLPPEGQRHLGLVRDQTQKMAALIDDLLELARIGRRELGRHPLTLGDFVRNCLRELQPELEGRNVEWVIGELPTLNADPILLKQLFLNLLSNALKYTRKRDGARIEIGAERRGAEQVVFVRDNGAGFDMAHAEKLFVVFQRLHAEEEYSGTGIGLAIVRRVAERHGARVWAEATPGRGATFYIAFPAAG
jgi:light-regulated signal transduction histidine kinase (bacteriophytochrome)